ncbi:hypothetical protein Y032_0004g1985 [Ancylostoma ceylanicum]|uniref:Uncharacterized protein n=1 Tax=Ancylostoma ceylanicum TaxID=53326 RepID=A0A016VV11_9BILA|nr:hypothetical protein Y032_0004g1985 [Ancylostoma ceylanicum]
MLRYFIAKIFCPGYLFRGLELSVCKILVDPDAFAERPTRCWLKLGCGYELQELLKRKSLKQSGPSNCDGVPEEQCEYRLH